MAYAKPAGGGSLEGRRDAGGAINNVVIPFRLDVAGKGDKITGALHNGDQAQTETGAKIENGVVTLNFDQPDLYPVYDCPRSGERTAED